MIRKYLKLCSNCQSYFISFSYDTDKAGADTCIMIKCPLCHKVQQAMVGVVTDFTDSPLSLRWRSMK